MKIIKYFNDEKIYNEKEITNKFGITEKQIEVVSNIKPQEYKTEDKELEYWLDIIKKTYGKYGEVTWEENKEIKESTEIEILKKQVLETQSLLAEMEYKKLLNKNDIK